MKRGTDGIIPERASYALSAINQRGAVKKMQCMSKIAGHSAKNVIQTRPTMPNKPFLPALESLMERATKPPWSVYAGGTTTQIGTADNPGSRPCVVGWPGFDSTDLPLKKNRANAELIAFLANHAPAIARLVRDTQAIAAQWLPEEMSDGLRGHADYEGAYIALVKIARDAIAALNAEEKA